MAEDACASVPDNTNKNCRNLSHIPEISFGDIENFIAPKCESSGAKEAQRGYKYFAEKVHLQCSW